MRERSRARGGWVALLGALIVAPAVGARGTYAQANALEQLEREVPEVRSVTGETPRAAADAMVRSLLARFANAPAESPTPVPASAPASAAPATRTAAPASVEPIYRYVDRGGHVVYTNIVETVPLAQRERGKLDLRRISLNTELGAELSARLRQEHATRIQAPICDQLRRAVDAPLLQRVSDEHAPLVGGTAALIVFTLCIPFVLGRFGVSLSMRVLATIIPLMAVFALGAHGLEQARTNLQTLRHKAEPCLAEAFSRLTRRGEGLEQQAELVRSLVALEASADTARGARPTSDASPGRDVP